MKFKKDDLLVLNDLGREIVYGENESKTKKNKINLYRVRFQLEEESVNLESADRGEHYGNLRSDLFRKATSMEIKISTIKKTFSKSVKNNEVQKKMIYLKLK